MGGEGQGERDGGRGMGEEGWGERDGRRDRRRGMGGEGKGEEEKGRAERKRGGGEEGGGEEERDGRGREREGKVGVVNVESTIDSSCQFYFLWVESHDVTVQSDLLVLCTIHEVQSTELPTRTNLT